MNTNKSRILKLLSYLYHYTDEEHPITTEEIIEKYSSDGEVLNRKTVYADIQALTDEGWDIRKTKANKFNAYYMATREFTQEELKLLVDAVCAAQFIDRKTTRSLIEKLQGFTSQSKAQELDRYLYTAAVKTVNSQVLETIDLIYRAIQSGKKISFRYYTYTAGKQRVQRHGGEVYVLSPYALVWDNNRYYVIGFSEKIRKEGQFRVDRIGEAVLLEEKQQKPSRGFTINRYVKTKFGMFGDGKTQKVVLDCDQDRMDAVIDRFGEKVKTLLTENGFRAEVEVSTSPNFYAWVFTYAPQIRIQAPAEAVQAYQEMVRQAAQ